MAAQSIATRPRRTQQVEADDVLLTRAIHFTEWARRNIVLVGGILAVIVLAVAGFFWYRANVARQQDNAAIAFLQVEQSVMAGDDALASRDLQQFIQQHNGTPYADEARLLLGQIHLQAGRFSEAMQTVEPVSSRLDSALGAQAALLMAAAQDAAGQRDAAIATFLRVAEDAESDFRQQEGLVGAALLRTAAGDHAGAAELYRQLVERNEPGSQTRSLYEMRLAEAEALAATAP